MIRFAQIPEILLRAFDLLDTDLSRLREPVVVASGHNRTWCRDRLQGHALGELLDNRQLDKITAWVLDAHQQLEAHFITEEEGNDDDGRHFAHWHAVEELTTLLSRHWEKTQVKPPLMLSIALGNLTYGRAFPLAKHSTQLRSWLYAAYDAHQLYVQQGALFCSQPGSPNYQPPEKERLDWV